MTVFSSGWVAAEGEPDGVFPNWQERWFHQLHNRARCDPQHEMAECGPDCAEGACYLPTKPLTWTSELNRAARFHSENLTSSICGMMHNSPCTLVTSIGTLYPDSCDGGVSCACESGTENCSGGGTSVWGRISLFDTTGHGENILSTAQDLNSAFYLMLFQSTSDPTCGPHGSSDNIYRHNILNGPYQSTDSLGCGIANDFITCDFGPGPDTGRIPSGSHYPHQASSVEFWTNWYDVVGPSAASVNVEGNCHPMTLGRGSATNGAWTAGVSGVDSGCFRYYFEFVDSNGFSVTYPTSGSLAIGSGAGCPDWDLWRPAACLGSPDWLFSDGLESGNTDRWSSAVP